MSTIKKSLEENMEYILSRLPQELRADAEQNCLKQAEDTPDPAATDEEIIAEIKAALPEDLVAEFEKNPVLPTSEPVPSLAEQKAEVLKALPEAFAEHATNLDKELKE